jgi:DNA-binding MarR family transcriptional regulator
VRAIPNEGDFLSARPTSRAELVDALMREGRELSTVTVLFHHAIATCLGLNTTDHKCADLLSRTGPLTAGALAQRTGLTTGAITGVIDRLEGAGLVKREADPADRRRVIVKAFPDPRRAREVARLFDSLMRTTSALLENYTDAELVVILDYVRRAKAALHEEAAKLRADADEKRCPVRTGRRR